MTCLPTPVGEVSPPRVARHHGQEPKDLGVTRRPVAPAVANALDEFWAIRRIRMGNEKSFARCLTAAHDVGGSAERQLDEVRTLRGRPTAASACTIPSVP